MMPCLHTFCYECIVRRAETTPKCPLCKRTATSILHLLRADDNFTEHVIPLPAAASTAVHPTRRSPVAQTPTISVAVQHTSHQLRGRCPGLLWAASIPTSGHGSSDRTHLCSVP